MLMLAISAIHAESSSPFLAANCGGTSMALRSPLFAFFEGAKTNGRVKLACESAMRQVAGAPAVLVQY